MTRVMFESKLVRDAVEIGAIAPKTGKPCRRWLAWRYPIAIECEHGYDVCAECDPCSCGECS